MTISERVAAGTAWLDEKIPGWWQQIELSRLDLWSACDCTGRMWPADTVLEVTAREAKE